MLSTALHLRQRILKVMIFFSIITFLGSHITIMFSLANNQQAQIMLNMGMEEEHQEKVSPILSEFESLFAKDHSMDLLDLSNVRNEMLLYKEPVIELPPRPPRA